MRLAFAGAGMISVVHALSAAAVDAPVIAVASRTRARAVERAEQTGARALDYRDLPAGADAIVVCTPPDRHLADTMKAIDAGVAVLVEKPLAATLTEADRLVDEGGRVLYGENLAYSPLFVATHRAVADLGPLEFVEIRQLSPRPTWGEFLDPRRGGGVLFDLGSHAIALALLLAGADAPVSVRASLGRSPDLDVDDAAEVLIEFASGLRARIEVDWRSVDTVWDIQASSADGVVRTELIPRPEIEVGGEPVELPLLRESTDPMIERLGYVEQMRTLAAVVDGADPPVDARFGRRVLELICAAYAAAHTPGSAVALPFTGRRDRTPHQLWSDTVGP